MSDEVFDPDDAGNLLTRELRIIEFVDPEGDLNTVDLSQSTGGEELSESDYLDMAMWAFAYAIASRVAAVLVSREDDQ